MDELKDFKDISSRIMDGITVTPGLKERTLEKCRKNNSLKPVVGILVPAACVVLAVAALGTMGWLGGSKAGMPGSSPEATIMMEAARETDVSPRDSGGDMLKSARQGETVGFESLAQAGKAFGEDFLQPGYIPGGFKLTAAEGLIEGKDNTTGIVLTYQNEKYSFQIIEEKTIQENQTKQQKELQGYRAIEIKGTPAYVKAVGTAGEGGGPASEIIWYGRETLYSVTGQLEEAEVIKIAEAMGGR